MKNAQMTPLTMDEFYSIYDQIPGNYEIERVEGGGMIAAKCVKHPEHGDIILVSTHCEGGLMIHG